jgi:transcriptional regulator GlxA family with amidase domain
LITAWVTGWPVEEITTTQLAELAQTSRFVLYRAFRSAHGMAPSDYQRQRRLRAARRLLAEGRPVPDAAVTTGFHDQSHLTRWFTRTFGMTPGVYQRAGRG